MLDLTVIIQAGGQSSRMGRDKGLLQFGDKTLIEYICGQIGSLGYPSLIISNQPENYRFLGLPVFMDAIREIGALGGIYSGLYFARSKYVLMLGCDMPFINLDVIRHMLGLARTADVVIPVTDEKGGMEPFRAVYAKSCKPAIREAIASGERRVISFFPAVQVREVGPDELRRFDPDLQSFINLNTPKEYDRALAIIKG